MNSVVKLEIRNGQGRKFLMSLNLDAERPNEKTILDYFGQRQLYEHEVCSLLTRALQPGDTFIDVGANAGYFTVMAGLLVGKKGNVLAIEPGDNTLNRLDDNIILNALENVKVSSNPISDHEGFVEFWLNDQNSGGNSLWPPQNFSPNAGSTQQKLRLHATTLDRLLLEGYPSWPPPKLIKIDTEGAEHNVLRGAEQLLFNHRIPYIVAELHEPGLEQMHSSQTELREYMYGLGYDTYILYPDGSLPKLIPPGTRISSVVFLNMLFSHSEAVGRLWQQETYDYKGHPSPRGSLMPGAV
jgi:FkbM family methyltransferase